jgi:hypothetical protein
MRGRCVSLSAWKERSEQIDLKGFDK